MGELGELIVLIGILIAVVAGFVWYFLDLNDKLPKIPQKGPMYPKILARNGEEWIERKEDAWNVCAICRCKYVPTPDGVSPMAQIGFNHMTGRLYCKDCEPQVESGSICSEDNLPPFISDRVLYKSLHSRELLIMTLVSDIQHGDISVDEARQVIEEVADKMFLKTFKRKQGIPSGYSWQGTVRSCGVCGGDVGDCYCFGNYAKDCQAKRFPKRIRPYLKKLQEFDPDYEKHFGEYFCLEDWQNIQHIMNQLSRERLSAYYAEKQIDAYIDTVIPDLKAAIKYYEARKRGENPQSLILPSEPAREPYVPAYQLGEQEAKDLRERMMGN